MSNNKIILGFIGLMSSGKGTAAEYLKDKHGATTYRFSTMLRDGLDRFYLPHTRDNLIKFSEIMRGAFGEEVMAKTMAGDAERDSSQLIIVEGIRRLADIEYLSKLPNFILIEIFADPKLRHQRMTMRRENPDDANKTFEQFMADHQRSTELTIPEVAAKATERVDNNGTTEQLNIQLDNLVKKYLK